MKIVTTTCSKCGTVVAGNVLEQTRVIKCPGVGCHEPLRFDDLSNEAQEFLEKNRDDLSIDG